MSNATEHYPIAPYPNLSLAAYAPLLDAGVRWTPNQRMGFGLSLCDAGPAIRYAADSWPPDHDSTVPPPWTTRLGGRVRVVDLEPVQVDLLAEVSGSWTEKCMVVEFLGASRSLFFSTSRSIAMDALLWKTLSLRLGYLDDPASDRYGLTFGLGFRLRDLLRLDLGTDELTYHSSPNYYPYHNRDWRLSIASSNLVGLWRRE
jgi:hypothetical protein